MSERHSAGLTAIELRAALAELTGCVLPADVIDLVSLEGRDDLVLFVRPLRPDASKAALHLVPGAHRGRVTTTARRFGKADVASHPGLERAAQVLVGATLVAAEPVAGERIARLSWRRDGAAGSIVVELFGNRGLWCVLDGTDAILAMSRLPKVGNRTLALGAPWLPPPPRETAADPPPRFAPPVLAGIDRWFTAADREADAAVVRAACQQALTRAGASAQQKVAGLERQLAGADEAPRLRADADLMLAYAHTVRMGQTSMRVPDPAHEGGEIELPLAPDKPVVLQAKALYERARRLTDAVAVTRARLAKARTDAEAVPALLARLAAAHDLDELHAVRDDLARTGFLPRARTAAQEPRATPREGGGKAKAKAKAADEAYRRFVSEEGHEILCGRTNAQNDRLTLKTARGNDVWLHVGRGHAGSHVVVRVPKGKTASLETLLDAATIAVHFSKARGAAKAEVVYTKAKHVRKPKGAPAGSVVPAQTKTLFVRLDEARLRRLLDGSGEVP